MSGRCIVFIFGASLWVLLGARAAAAADLVWATKEIDTSARLDEDKVESVFHFKNEGQTPVTILTVSTSCGCTVAAPDKKTYLPGESGEIKATFTVGGRSGLQEKTIVVESTDTPDTPTSLTLKVAIPEAFALEPRLLIWVAGANTPAVEKSALLTAAPSALTLNVRDVVSDDPGFKVRLLTEVPGKRFRIAVTPVSLEKPLKSLVRLHFEGPPGTERTAVVYVLIR